jgi:formylglycine-generating enzyme required for sulfatase activity
MLRRLDRVESELTRVAGEQDAAPGFVQQSGLISLYVNKMRVKLDLTRLHLTIDEVTFDLGALTGAVRAMGEITTRFQVAVDAWAERVSHGLTDSTKAAVAAVLRVVRGARTLGRVAIRDVKRGAANGQAEQPRPGEPEMVLIQRGTFIMGVPEAESTSEKTENLDQHARPQHRVTIRRLFLLGRFPVTRGEYDEFVRETNRDWQPPRFEQTSRHPAVNVSFEDAVAYAAWLSERTGHRYRLPSEAEWEYACRAGTETARYWGEGTDPGLANFDGEATTEVDTHKPNPWGLYDMLGNVWEWVEDVWHETYAGAPEDGSAWARDGDPSLRVLRGGSWNDYRWDCRAGRRGRYHSGDRFGDAGFRLARDV